MKIKNLYLKNFRNHTHLTLEFDSNITFIYGDNGLGKTNILEAIYFLATTKSLKAEVDKDLINYHNNYLIAKASISTSEEEISLEATIDYLNTASNRSTKKVKINQVPKSITNFAGKLKSVLFTPADLDNLFSSSSVRRKYLDSIFYQISEEYKKSIIDYTKSLKQRNKILETYRESGKGIDQLDIWTSILIKEGTIIQNYRQSFFNFFNENINSLYEKLGLNEILVEIIYKKNEASEENFRKNYMKEIHTGNSACGPHKDDFEILFNKKDVSSFGSRGQQRISISILKFTELDFIYSTTKERPVLLLDDIFSELDEKNKNAILNLIHNQQTIVTSVYLMKEFENLDSKIINIKRLINQ
jgi:DNA replication and repair protein RecF